MGTNSASLVAVFAGLTFAASAQVTTTAFKGRAMRNCLMRPTVAPAMTAPLMVSAATATRHFAGHPDSRNFAQMPIGTGRRFVANH